MYFINICNCIFIFIGCFFINAPNSQQNGVCYTRKADCDYDNLSVCVLAPESIFIRWVLFLWLYFVLDCFVYPKSDGGGDGCFKRSSECDYFNGNKDQCKHSDNGVVGGKNFYFLLCFFFF